MACCCAAAGCPPIALVELADGCCGTEVGPSPAPALSGTNTLPSSAGILALCFLNGEPMISGASAEEWKSLPSDGGGVPALAEVEFTEAGVLAEGESSAVRWGDLRVMEDSEKGSAECWRLSCGAGELVCG